LAFKIQTWPLALKAPLITELSLPVTRLSAMALLLGCTKLTLSWAPILKLVQLIARFWLPWVTVVALPFWLLLMLPLPALTLPPVGPAHAALPAPMRLVATAAAMARRVLRPLDLPRPRVVSGTAWQHWAASFQTR